MPYGVCPYHLSKMVPNWPGEHEFLERGKSTLKYGRGGVRGYRLFRVQRLSFVSVRRARSSPRVARPCHPVFLRARSSVVNAPSVQANPSP